MEKPKNLLSREKLIEWINENLYGKKGRINSNLKIMSKREEVYDSLIYYTSFLSDYSTMSEKVYCFLNNFSKLPVCKICEKKVKFRSFEEGYNLYCSKSCGSKYRYKSEETRKKISKSLTGKPKSEEHKKKLSDLYKGKTYEEIHGEEKAKEIKEKQSKSLSNENNPMYGKVQTEETKQKISKANKGKVAWNKGIPRSKECIEKTREKQKGRTLDEIHGKEKAEEIREKISKKSKLFRHSIKTKQKMREIAIKRAKENGGYFCSYNKKACEYFKWFDEVNNTQGIYATKPYEYQVCGYFLDYINFENYIIIEWDEEHHYIENALRLEDIIRQKEIEECLPSFKFIRIRESEFDLENYTNII